ncbi:PREDICTED: serine-threonine kinase receptor-associated protein [Propithecus coquereli]|uniref:serine-threonine kinase receptor-associated protein n=1 Tax=Propithecus coquereli TaxID=379532 RepID=UPI00063F1C42|nr:PREDICTED: serine-threonine kinase receptor-associated protein [Propithecus coquereli]
MAMRQTPLTCSGHTRPVVDLAFSGITPYGYFLISACKDGKPMLRQGDTGDWIGTFLGHKGAVWGATLNKDATKAATAAADFTAKVWDAVSGDELMTLAHKHIVKTVDFTQDSNYLLTGGQDKLLRIYDLNKPEAGKYNLCIKSYKGHFGPIHCVRFSPDGELYASGSEDGTLRLWQTVVPLIVEYRCFDYIEAVE